MRKINISKEEVLENFKILGALPDDLHKKLVEKGKIRVDDFNDLEVNIDGEKYWVTTCMFIARDNKMGDYNINIEYEIHKDSKYSKTLYTFTR
jgi:hypothetical protein